MSSFDLGPTRGLRPDERDDAPVASLGEMWSKTWEDTRKVQNFDAHLVNYSNAFDSISDRVKAATGEALDNPFRTATAGQSVEMLGAFSREAVEGATLYAQWRQNAEALKAKHPDKLDWDALLEEPGRAAWESMKKAREEADALSERIGMVNPREVPIVGGVPVVNAIAALGANAMRHPQYTAAQLAAGFAAQMTSPADAAVNLISFGAGGAAKSIIKNATANALTNAAGQALLSGPKQLSYQSAGLPYGWQVWADEVGAAAGAGFALDAGIRTPARAAISRFGRDTPAGTAFSRNTERGGIIFDAVTDATPAPRPRIEIDPETIRKAEAGDIAASREILEKTGAMEDPAVKGAVEHMEAGGKLTEDVLSLLEREFGIARPDGMRTLADAMNGRFTDRLPDPIRQAPEPLQPEQGAAILERAEAISGVMESLPARLREAVEDGLQAGVPRIVQAVERALKDAPPTLAAQSLRIKEAVALVLDDRTMAEVRLHSGRAGPIEMARSIRQFPDLIDSNARLDDGRLSMARTIAGMDDRAYADVARGTVPAEVAVMVAERVPRESQAKVLADLQRAEPRSAAEAADLIEALTPPRRVPGTEGQLAAGSKVDDPAGPEAKAQTETLRQEAGQTYVDVMAPIERRAAIEDEIKKLRGQLIKGKREDAPQKAEGGEAEASGPGDIRRQIEALEREHAALQAEIDQGPQGQVLARLAMRAIDRRREADLVAAVNDAMRMLPEGVRVEVRPDDDLVFRAANGERADAATDMATGHVQLAVSAMDPIAKIGHEVVHALVTLGYISWEEIRALATLAREAGTFKLEDRYRKAYAGRDNLEQIITEEAAASYIEARIKGDVKGPKNTIVERVRQLMERIRQALKGYGFQSREDVVQAIMSGEAARREARAEWRRDAVIQGKAEMKAAAERGTTLPDGTEIKGVPLFAIRAFHGSPHDFDRFSMDRIGTGEGAQAFGHGLYFAENEAVARSYRDTLGDYSGNVKWTGAEPPDDLQRALLKQLAGTDARGEMMTVDKLRRELLSIRRASAVMDDDGRIVAGPGAKGDEYRRATALYEELGRSDGLIRIDPPGRLYEVRINAEPEDFLDWDKPLSEQGEKVRSALSDHKPEWSGGQAYESSRLVPGDFSDKKAAAEALRRRGLAGIKYLDQGSRGAGEGSHNFVVFDDSLIEIVAKDGEPVAPSFVSRISEALRSEDITAAVRSPDGRLFAFAGERAKTADLDALARAQQMDGAGEDRTRIWADTGWFKGVDGRWRFEISDADMSVASSLNFSGWPFARGRQAMAHGIAGPRSVIQHEALAAAYPESRDIAVMLEASRTLDGGSFSRDPLNVWSVGRNPSEVRSNALHELQHFVQDREGFARGANTRDAGYRETAGEVEARTIEKRMNLTPDERRARPPWLDYDVPESEQIVRGGEQLFALKPRSAGIPETATSLSSFTRDTEIKADPDYKAAKAGDHEAAGRLAERLVTPEQRARALEAFGSDAVYVPVMAQEASGLNAIPEAVAHVYAASTGAQVAENIVQSSRAYHTGARPLERIISRPTFDGAIVAGKRYVIVDDVTVMGGTLAELASYIREGGGEVAGTVTLANASRTGRISPDARDIKIIEERFGDLLRDELGVEPRALTADEANYLVNFRDADALRDSIAKASREREKRLLSKGIRASEAEADRGPGPDLTTKGDDPLFALREPEPPLKADMAFVDRMNRMSELIAVCRG